MSIFSCHMNRVKTAQLMNNRPQHNPINLFALILLLFVSLSFDLSAQVVGPYTGIDHATDFTNPDAGGACGSIATINAEIGDVNFLDGSAEIPLGWSFSGTWASGATYVDGPGDEVLLVSLHTYTESWNVSLRISDGTTTASAPYDLTIVTDDATGSLATCGAIIPGFTYERPSQLLDFADFIIPPGEGVIGILFEPFSDGAGNPDVHGVMILEGTEVDPECEDLVTTVSATDICIGETVTLTALSENDGGITWDGGVVDGEAFEPPVGTTTYTATSDSDLDCIFSVDITVHELPDVTASVDPEEICLGETVTFTGDGADTYEWDMGVEDGVDFEPLTIGTETYTVTGTDEFGCENTASVDLIVSPLPVCDFEFVINGFSSEDGATGGCVVSTVEFNDLSTVGDPGTITEWDWGFGDGSGSDEENPDHVYGSSGTYTVTLTVTTAGGCSATYELDIIMTDALVLDIVFNEPTCFGFTDGSVTVNVTGGLGDLIFEITDVDGELLNEDNSNTANTLGEGWYYINVSDDSECSGLDSVYLTQPGELDISINLTNPLCFGDETGIAVVTDVINYTGSDDMISYIWNPNPGGNSGLGEDSTWAMGAGDYTVTINDENGCSKVFDFTITEPTEMTFPEFGFEHAFCRLHEYQSGNGVVFGAAAGGTPDYSYVWTNLDNGETTINSTWGGLNPGNYELTATDDNGCILKETVFLDSLNPVAAFTVVSDQLNDDCQGTATIQVQFENESMNFANPNNPGADTTFFWNLDDPTAEWQVSHDVSEVFDTVYTPQGQTYFVDVCLVALNKNGCTDTACKVITVYEPVTFDEVNIFSPNGDGVNDEFTFEFKSASIAEFNCVIVNRWGIVVHELNDINDGWDGTDRNGDPCTAGVYFYKYTAKTDNSTDLEGQGSLQIVLGN